ncbi:hypothetical protein AVEN_241501-1, partial [Araneus ventricosus]
MPAIAIYALAQYVFDQILL